MQSSRADKWHRWPTGHLAWAYAGADEFEGRVASFLAEGLARNERLLLVTDDPTPRLWPSSFVAQGALLISSTAEVYGPMGALDPAAQRLTFEELLGKALELGFSGLRVAADDTCHLSSTARLAAWLEWEEVADDLMATEPITGLCAFDRTKTTDGALAAAMRCHRAAVG